MAALELRNKNFRVVFIYEGHKYAYSLDTGDRDIAEALRGGVEKTLMLVQQNALRVPDGVDSSPSFVMAAKSKNRQLCPPNGFPTPPSRRSIWRPIRMARWRGTA